MPTTQWLSCPPSPQPLWPSCHVQPCLPGRDGLRCDILNPFGHFWRVVRIIQIGYSSHIALVWQRSGGWPRLVGFVKLFRLFGSDILDMFTLIEHSCFISSQGMRDRERGHSSSLFYDQADGSDRASVHVR